MSLSLPDSVKTYLDRGKNRRYIIGRTPAVLEDIKTNTTVSIDIGVKHLTDESEENNDSRDNI